MKEWLKWKKFLKYFALAAILITFLGFFATKIWDVDFWWHISSGKYIVETRSLPDSDPFSVYTTAGARDNTILKSNWLGQVILYQVFNDFGEDGVILLKAAILTICLLIVYLRSLAIGSNPIYALLIIVPIGMTAVNFSGERPQLFAFVYVSLIFLFLDNFERINRKLWLYLIPIVVILWANSHGSIVLGSALLGIYGVNSVIEHKIGTADKNHFNLTLLVVLGISILSTSIMPGGIDNYLTVIQMEGSELQTRTSEYMSPFGVWLSVGNKLPFYWMLLVISVLSLHQLIKNKEINKSVTILALAAISLAAYRYIPFFIFIAGPYIAFGISRMTSRRIPEKIINIIAILISVAILIMGIHSGKVFQSGIKNGRFPEGAVNFIKQHGIRGKVFNSMEWGGYLIWYLYPDSHIYIDGRLLDLNKLHKYTHILWATSEGLDSFESEHFDVVLIPFKNRFSGETYGINWYLLNHPQWQVLYRDNLGYLFRRRG